MTKSVLITGAAGSLGSAIAGLLTAQNYQLFLLDLKKEFLQNRFPDVDEKFFYTSEDFANGRIPLQNIDLIIHCAFARTQQGKDLVASINLSEKIYQAAVRNKVPAVINISSQSIYGGYRETDSTEDGEINPLDSYAIAKYACEKLAAQISAGSATQITNIRLASLIGPQFKERLVNKMLKIATETGKIKIVGGSQTFSFLDIRDAADGIVAMLKVPPQKWQNIYNLGTSQQYSIVELAETIAAQVGGVEIEIEPQDIKMQIRLDCSRFAKDFGWQAKHKLADTVKNIAESMVQNG